MVQERVSVDVVTNAVRVEVGKDYAMTFAQMNDTERAAWARTMARKIRTNQDKVFEMGYFHHA